MPPACANEREESAIFSDFRTFRLFLISGKIPLGIYGNMSNWSQFQSSLISMCSWLTPPIWFAFFYVQALPFQRCYSSESLIPLQTKINVRLWILLPVCTREWPGSCVFGTHFSFTSTEFLRLVNRDVLVHSRLDF